MTFHQRVVIAVAGKYVFTSFKYTIFFPAKWASKQQNESNGGVNHSISRHFKTFGIFFLF